MALEEVRKDALRCTRCSYCKWVPMDLVKSARFAYGCSSIAYGNFHSYSAGGRLVTALSLLEGRSEITDRVVDSTFKCTLCGSCDVTCKVCRYDMEPVEKMQELRFHLVEKGKTPARHAPVMGALRSEWNMAGGKKENRGLWAEGLPVKDLTEDEAEVVFHAGCRYSFDSDLQQVARTSVEICQKAGLDFGILGREETCCGGRAYHMGYKKEYGQGLEHTTEKWRKAGVKTVVTPCADCYQCYKRLYPASGSEFEVIHMVELVARLLGEKKLEFTKSVPLKVTYHDPCNLGRRGEPYVPWDGRERKMFGQAVVYDPPRPRYIGAKGVYDAPRDVLRAIPGVELVEMERIREASWCCGAGAGARETYPDYSAATAQERVEEAKTTGADAMVTACPWCERNFIEAVDADGTRMKVLDVMDLVAQAL